MNNSYEIPSLSLCLVFFLGLLQQLWNVDIILLLCVLFTSKQIHPIYLFLQRRLLAQHPVAKRSGHAADGQAWEPDLLENMVRNVLDRAL